MYKGVVYVFCVLNITHAPISVAARSNALFCGRSLAGIAGWNPAGVMDFCLRECCVLSGRGLCVGLIARPEETYRVW